MLDTQLKMALGNIYTSDNTKDIFATIKKLQTKKETFAIDLIVFIDSKARDLILSVLCPSVCLC